MASQACHQPWSPETLSFGYNIGHENIPITRHQNRTDGFSLKSRFYCTLILLAGGCSRVRGGSHPGEDDSDSDVASTRGSKRRSFVGTAQYLSPEILTSRGSCRASDLWAIGCIIYQMITGLPPFQSDSGKTRRCNYLFSF